MEQKQIEKISFHGHKLMVAEKNGNKLVALKPICEALGLDWGGQFKMIQKDPVLSSVIVVTTITAADGKNYQTDCLPLSYLNGWLFKIPASRYKGEKQKAIITYQKECYNVLYRYWHEGGAINPRATESQFEELLKRYERTVAELHNERIEKKHYMILADQYENVAETWRSKSEYNSISKRNGLHKRKKRRGAWVADPRGGSSILLNCQQGTFVFVD